MFSEKSAKAGIAFPKGFKAAGVKAGIKRQEASECENLAFAKITQIMRFKIDVLTLNCYYCIRKGGMRDAAAV